MTITKALTCWIVTDGKPGTETQCIGLAQALHLNPIVKRIKLRRPWLWVTPYLRGFERFAFRKDGDPIGPPWPDLFIGSGRRALPAAFAARKACGDRIAIVQLQNPHCSLTTFDLVIAPQHDQLHGPNVLSVLGGLHKLTPQAISAAADAQRSRFAQLPAPHLAVAIGGKSMAYDFGMGDMQRLIEQMKSLLQVFGGSLIITTSRRTSASNLQLLQDALGTHPRVWIWDGTDDNPYPGILGLADWIVVTADSTSMIAEAVTTGKPVYVFELTGGTQRFDRFHTQLREAGITRVFTGKLENWHYPPLLETERAAAAVQQVLDRKFGASHS